MAIVNNAKQAAGKLPNLEQILAAQGAVSRAPAATVASQVPVGSLQQQVRQAMAGGLPVGAQFPQQAAQQMSIPAGGFDLAASRGTVGPAVSTATRGLPQAAVQQAPGLADDAIKGLNMSRGVVGPVSQVPAAAANTASVGSRAATAASAAKSKLLPNGLSIASKGAALRGGALGVGGMMAGDMVDNMDIGGENSFLDQFLSGGVMGAGAAGGAALAMGGPVGWAALGGGLLAGGAKALFGDDETKAEKMTNQLNDFNSLSSEMGANLGIRPDAMEEALLPINLQIEMAMETGDKQMLEQTIAAAQANLPQLVQQAYGQSQIMDQEEDRYSRMIANQAQFAPIFDRAMERSSLASQQSMQISNDIASQLEGRAPGLADMVRSTAANSNSSQEALMAAYAGQLALQPQVTADNNLLQERVAQQEMLAQMM